MGGNVETCMLEAAMAPKAKKAKTKKPASMQEEKSEVVIAASTSNKSAKLVKPWHQQKASIWAKQPT